jgi:hypothetical protein
MSLKDCRFEAGKEYRLINVGSCGALCASSTITTPRAGDGYCPAGANFTVDTDCAPLCGNGIVESPAETCDYAAGEGSCPRECAAASSCTHVEPRGQAENCSATCVSTPITDCVSGDRCCPSGCTRATDSDCAIVCGDGVKEMGETCDRAITAGKQDACPRSCDDSNACTLDIADGSVEGCTRTCAYLPITACIGGDGCCPPGCTAAADADCNPRCGDGRVGVGETCDPATTCPTTCPDDGDRCTLERLTGDPRTCDAYCRHTPITDCSGTNRDGCCPTGCTLTTDVDC